MNTPRAAVFYLFLLSLPSGLGAQMLVQHNADLQHFHLTGPELGNVTIYNLSSAEKTLRVQVYVLDSALSVRDSARSAYHTFRDSLDFSGKIVYNKNSSSLSIVSGFLQYEIQSDEETYTFLFEARFIQEQETLPDKGEKKKEWIKIGGKVSVRYDYQSQTPFQSRLPKHNFMYQVQPEVSLFGIPLKGNFRLNQLDQSVNRGLTFNQISLDTDKLMAMRKAYLSDLESKKNSYLQEIETKARNKAEEELLKLEADIREKQKGLDTLKTPSFSIPDSLSLPDKPDIENPADSLVPDSLNRYIAYRDSLTQKLTELKERRDSLHSFVEALKTRRISFTEQDSITDSLAVLKQEWSSWKTRLLKKEIKGLKIGALYPELPKSVRNQYMIRGAEIALGQGETGKRIYTAGVVQNESRQTQHLNLLHYTQERKAGENHLYRISTIYIGSGPEKASYYKTYNPILVLSSENSLVNTPHLQVTLRNDLTTSFVHIKGASAGYSLVGVPENSSVLYGYQQVFNNQVGMNLYSKAAFDLKKTQTGITAEADLTNGKYSTLLSPFAQNNRNVVKADLRQRLWKGFVQLQGGVSRESDNVQSRINSGHLSFRLNPRRGPSAEFGTNLYKRSFNGSSSASHQLQSYYLNSTYSFQTFRIPSQFLGQVNYQENKMDQGYRVYTISSLVSYQLLPVKGPRLALQWSGQEYQVGLQKRRNHNFQAKVHHQVSKYWSYSHSQGIAPNGNQFRYLASTSLGARYKSLQGSFSHQYNTMSLSGLRGDMIKVNRHQLTVLITYSL